MLLLLAQLGRRAGDGAALKWCDIAWHAGTRCGMGKNRRQTRLPLPQDVGEAILDYAEHQHPRVPSPYVFLTTLAPLRPISPKTVTKITADALRRAHVESPISGAHVLRHSAATNMLRQGASLPSIGAVLRHAAVEPTAHYAKVDVDLLHEVVRAWPEVSPGGCQRWTPISPCVGRWVSLWYRLSPPYATLPALPRRAGRLMSSRQPPSTGRASLHRKRHAITDCRPWSDLLASWRPRTLSTRFPLKIDSVADASDPCRTSAVTMQSSTSSERRVGLARQVPCVPTPTARCLGYSRLPVCASRKPGRYTSRTSRLMA